MLRRLRKFIVLILFAAVTGFARADSPSAIEIYGAAIRAMNDLPQPQFVSYRLEGIADGLTVSPTVINHLVWLNIRGGSTPSSWTMHHRTFDYQSEIVDLKDNRRYVSARSFFDPTWYGADRALREGMLYAQDPAAPRAAPAQTPDPSKPLRTIAVTSVMGNGLYSVSDRGEATCSSGDAGRALHLDARSHDGLHQLSDVVVDLQSMRFCMMRFATGNGFGFHGTVEEHYADIGGFWMVTDGVLSGSMRAFGIDTHHGEWRFRLTDMTFPVSLPQETFESN